MDPVVVAPVVLDGSEGEGGGQILRTALSLALITQRPFEIRNIRAHRKPPGLRPQHLACVRGAEAISGSTSEGAEVNASELRFVPSPTRAGDYLLEIGTAGSAPLLVQCLFYPLALAGGGNLAVRGGTHLPHSPSYHYLAAVWAPALAKFGLGAELHLKQAGFYPQGGGDVRAVVAAPANPPETVDWSARGTLRDVEVTSLVAGIPFTVAERQEQSAVAALREKGIYATSEKLPLAARVSKGTAVFIRAHFEHTTAAFTALGERGKPAEDVGREAAAQVAEFLATGGAIDEHLGDQLLLPAAMLAAGLLGDVKPAVTRYTTARVTDHLTTNAMVIQRFLDVKIGVDSQTGTVLVAPPETR